MRRPEFIARHARLPEGILGRLIARITSFETRDFNLAVLRSLDLQAADRVLELGCGRGRTVASAAQVVTTGHVTGIDHSEVVIQSGTRRYRRFLQQGRVSLKVADSSQLPFLDTSFDKAFAVHTLYFWANPLLHLREVRRVLTSQGRFALGVRKKLQDERRESFPGSIYTFYSLDEIGSMLRESGFAHVQVFDAAGGISDLAIIIASASL
jgi:SAM-dependent methyltransferase